MCLDLGTAAVLDPKASASDSHATELSTDFLAVLRNNCRVLQQVGEEFFRLIKKFGSDPETGRVATVPACNRPGDNGKRGHLITNASCQPCRTLGNSHLNGHSQQDRGCCIVSIGERSAEDFAFIMVATVVIVIIITTTIIIPFTVMGPCTIPEINPSDAPTFRLST